MKYNTLPKLMWTCYKSSFKKCLTTVLNESNPALVMKEAHKNIKKFFLMFLNLIKMIVLL